MLQYWIKEVLGLLNLVHLYVVLQKNSHFIIFSGTALANQKLVSLKAKTGKPLSVVIFFSYILLLSLNEPSTCINYFCILEEMGQQRRHSSWGFITYWEFDLHHLFSEFVVVAALRSVHFSAEC